MDNPEVRTEDSILASSTEGAAQSLSQTKSSILPWVIFFTGISYYCFAYLLRVYPSVMEYQLRSHLNITASGFGLLTAFYYFAYAPMQLPVGVLVDRIGPRRSLIFASLVSTAGALMFAYFKLFGVVLLGRFLVGFGAGFAYVTALKLASVWLPRKYFATATGTVTGFGMVAAIFTDLYLTHAINVKGFEYAMYFPLCVGMVLIVLIFALLRDKPRAHQTEAGEFSSLSFRELLEYLVQIAKNRQMWVIGAVGALLYLPSSVFLDVWAIPYLEHVHYFSPEQAAMGVSIMLTGWIVSSFTSGALSDIFCTRKMPLVITSFLAAIVACMMLYLPGLSIYSLYALLFVFGFCCGPHPLCFTLSKENNPHRISGTAVAFANFVIMMGGFIFQPIVGDILDWLWDGKIVDGLRFYSPYQYIEALSILPLGLLLAGIITLFIKETYQSHPNS